MRGLIVVALMLAVVSAYAAKGDTVLSFTLSGQPANGVRGLAYDPTDGNIWAAGPQATSNIIFCKFKNDTSHAIVNNWIQAASMYWVFDIGWKYTYSGTDCLVFIDQNAPRICLQNPTTGARVGTLADPNSSSYDEGIEGDYKNGWGTTLYCDNYGATILYKWNGTSWSNFGTTLSPAMGCAYGWNHIFVIHTANTYTIRVLKATDGTLEEDIPLNNWGTKYMVGLARGRDNYNGTNETLYTATFYPSSTIYEIDIGQYNQTSIETTSVGNIKALFK